MTSRSRSSRRSDHPAAPSSGSTRRPPRPRAAPRGAAARTGLPAAARSAAAPAPPAAGRLELRRAAPGDLVPLQFFFDVLLRRDYFLRRGQLQELLAGRHHQVWIAELDAVLVGVAVTSGGCRLVNALVHPAYRGIGVGRALVGISRATEVRAKLDMSSGDPRPFYARLGFTPTGQFNRKHNIEIWRRAARGEPPDAAAAAVS